MMSKKIFNGNGRNITISVDFIVTTLAAIILALGGWGLLRVSQMNDCFATIVQVDKVEAQVKEEIKNVNNSCHENYSNLETNVNTRLNTFETNVSNRFDNLDNRFNAVDTKINGVELLLKGQIYGSRKDTAKR